MARSMTAHVMCPFGSPAQTSIPNSKEPTSTGIRHSLLCVARPPPSRLPAAQGRRERGSGHTRRSPGCGVKEAAASPVVLCHCALARRAEAKQQAYPSHSPSHPLRRRRPPPLLRLRNRLLPLLRAASSLPSPIHPRACHLLSTSTSTTLPAPFSLEDYLVASCGLAPAQAREVFNKASREISLVGSRRPLQELPFCRLNSSSNPDAILALLSGAGLSRADIAAVVSADPLLLRASVKNIAPRLVALRDRVGLSTPQIARFLMVSSRCLRLGDVILRLEFFISFFGSFDRVLVVAKRSSSLFKVSLEKIIKPNIALFRQRGVRDIAKVCLHCPWVLPCNPERVKEFLLRAEQLGVPAVSPLFRQAVLIVSRLSSEKVAGKFDFFKRTLGCSESEVSIAVSKMPQILGLSDATLLRKIKFLVNEAAMEPQFIMERPVLLAYSLEKRLVPRHYVMMALKEKGLMSSKTNIYSLVSLTEEAFKSKFIDCHKDSDPGLADVYAAASASIAPSRV